MDGGSNNDDLRGGSAGAQARTPLEAIQEFQVVTNQFDAAYGGATAGVINAVSKQGTNALRGSAFGYFTDASLTARDFFVEQQDLDKPDAQRKQWGGHRGRADRPRQDALLLQLRALRSRRGPQPRLPDAARQELHRHSGDQLLQLPPAPRPAGRRQRQLLGARAVGPSAQHQPGARRRHQGHALYREGRRRDAWSAPSTGSPGRRSS